MLKNSEQIDRESYKWKTCFQKLTKLALIWVLTCSTCWKNAMTMEYYPYNMLENREFFVQNVNYLVNNIANSSSSEVLNFIKNYPWNTNDMLYILKNWLRYFPPEQAEDIHLTIQIVYSVEWFRNKVTTTPQENTYNQEEDEKSNSTKDIPEAQEQSETWN